MMASSYEIGRVLGIPVRVHITLLILLPFIALSFGGQVSLLLGLSVAIGLFASVAAHELGHSAVAIRFGCRVRQILLLPIGGMAQMENMPSQPRQELLMALAGPGVSLALGFTLKLLAPPLFAAGARLPAVAAYELGRLNIWLALFNLIPSFPMDGGRVLRAWLTPRLGRLESTRIAAKIGRGLAVVFGIYGLFTWNLFLILIAVFVFQAAGAEYRAVAMQEATRRAYRRSAAEVDDDEIYVSPPPYRRETPEDWGRRASQKAKGWFDELFRDWD